MIFKEIYNCVMNFVMIFQNTFVSILPPSFDGGKIYILYT